MVNKKKCIFGTIKVEYANPKGVEAIRQWIAPKDIKGLRGFLELVDYYRRFVRGYDKLTRPLMMHVWKVIVQRMKLRNLPKEDHWHFLANHYFKEPKRSQFMGEN
ncbi:putative mitochondrial protein, partial [Mucuna pruriens]